MHPDLLKLIRYGFEIAPDKGMQIAFDDAGKIYKSPRQVPKMRVHAIYTGSAKVKYHYDQSERAETHNSSSNHKKVMVVRAFMDYVDGKREKGSHKFGQHIANLPSSTVMISFRQPTKLEMMIKRLSTRFPWFSLVNSIYQRYTQRNNN